MGGSIGLDYKAALNILGLIGFAALFALTVRRGATDPVCGMTVDRSKALSVEHGGTHLLLLRAGLPHAFRARSRRFHRRRPARTGARPPSLKV